MSTYQRPLHAAVAAALDAGRLLRDEFHSPGAAEADRAAEALLRERLREAALEEGQNGSHVWLVPAHDGARHARRGRRGAAVAVAALRDGAPVLGVVYAYAFPDGRGDLIAWAEGCGPLTRGGQPVEARLADADLDDPGLRFDPRLIVYLSPAADGAPALASGQVRPSRFLCVPSLSYRLALVAVGEGVAAVSLDSPGAAEYAAGHALLRGAGGVLVHADGRPVTYGADGSGACAACFGGAPKAVAALRSRSWLNGGRLPAAPPAPPRVRPARYERVRPAAGRAVTDSERLARAQGCLLGQFAGDALGGLVEFKTPEEIRARYPAGCTDLADGGTWSNLAGQPTDDSELALMLARTLVRDGRYTPEAVLDAYVDWVDDPETFDVGGTTARALHAARGATPAERVVLARASASTTSQANGSLMRVSPLGVFAAGRPAEAAGLARMDSGLTHPHPACADACAVYAAAVAHAVAAGGGPRDAYRAALAEAERSGAHPTVREALDDAGRRPPTDYVTNQGWVLIALQNAFFQLLHAPSLEEGVVNTVMAGGDTDTTAAIAGALLGAVYGREGVPPRWVRAVRCCRPLRGTPTRHPRAEEFWPTDALELAEALLLAGEGAGGLS